MATRHAYLSLFKKNVWLSVEFVSVKVSVESVLVLGEKEVRLFRSCILNHFQEVSKGLEK